MKEKYRGLLEESKIGSTKLTEEYIEFLQNSQTPLDIEDWYPKVPEDVFEKYPAWVETYFGLDATDSHPMKKVMQVVAVTLAMNGKVIILQDLERFWFFRVFGIFSVSGHWWCRPSEVLPRVGNGRLGLVSLPEVPASWTNTAHIVTSIFYFRRIITIDILF